MQKPRISLNGIRPRGNRFFHCWHNEGFFCQWIGRIAFVWGRKSIAHHGMSFVDFRKTGRQRVLRIGRLFISWN